MTMVLPPGRFIVLMGDAWERQQWMMHILADENAGYVDLASCWYPDMEQITVQLQTHINRQHTIDYLILDGCDAIPDKLPGHLLGQLLAQPDLRIILSGRRVPVCLRQNAMLRDLTAFFPAQVIPEKKILLEARAFGRGHIALDMLPYEAITGQLPALLLFYVLEYGAIDTEHKKTLYWLDKAEAAASNTFHSIKKTLHRELKRRLIVFKDALFQMSDKLHIQYDVAAFTHLLSAYQREGDVRLLETAIKLYQGDFLVGFEYQWVQQRRNALRERYHTALLRLAKYHLQHHDDLSAIGLLSRILRDAPHREDVSVLLMEIYAAMGLFDDAMRVYHRLRRCLMQDYNMPVSQSVQQLARYIRNNPQHRE